MNPEQEARQRIDDLLTRAGWAVQSPGAVNLYARGGVAVREFLLKPDHGKADYVLYVDGRAAGAVEAKRVGSTLTGVEPQSKKYSEGLPDDLPAWRRPLPFLYESTGTSSSTSSSTCGAF
jgi:type I restriction enzyme R subunit